MEDNENRMLWLWYSETSKEENLSDRTTIKVDYLSKTRIDYNEKNKLQNEFSNYIKNNYDIATDDVVDVVSSIRQITKNLEERRLRVSIEKYNYGEEVYYQDGLAYSCKIFKIVWDDEISVTSSHKGIEVNYKKMNFRLDDNSKVDYINSELGTFYKKVIMLNNMTKLNVETKNNSFKLTNIPRHKKVN